ncbi:MAG: ribosome modulation factor [Colwellia sp.]
MQQHKSNRGGNFSPRKKFDDITYQRDFETGQYAAMRGKHSSDCPFRLSDRKAAWLRGFRDATYNNEHRSQSIKSESTHGHIINLRNVLSGDKATIKLKVNKTYINE